MHWFKKWRLGINSDKCTHLTFALKQDDCGSVNIKVKTTTHNDSYKYLRLHLHRKLTGNTTTKQNESS